MSLTIYRFGIKRSNDTLKRSHFNYIHMLLLRGGRRKNKIVELDKSHIPEWCTTWFLQQLWNSPLPSPFEKKSLSKENCPSLISLSFISISGSMCYWYFNWSEIAFLAMSHRNFTLCGNYWDVGHSLLYSMWTLGEVVCDQDNARNKLSSSFVSVGN